MLIICSDEEKELMRWMCGGHCDNCVFKNVRCPIEYNMIVTNKEISSGKNLEVNLRT